jgi:hypothetical protein
VPAFVLARRGGGGAPHELAGVLLSAALLFLLFSPPLPILRFPLAGGTGVDGPASSISTISSISASSVAAPAETDAAETEAARSASMRAICLSRAPTASTGRWMQRSQNHCSGRVSGMASLAVVDDWEPSLGRPDKEGVFSLSMDEVFGLEMSAPTPRLDEGD